MPKPLVRIAMVLAPSVYERVEKLLEYKRIAAEEHLKFVEKYKDRNTPAELEKAEALRKQKFGDLKAIGFLRESLIARSKEAKNPLPQKFSQQAIFTELVEAGLKVLEEKYREPRK